MFSANTDGASDAEFVSLENEIIKIQENISIAMESAPGYRGIEKLLKDLLSKLNTIEIQQKAVFENQIKILSLLQHENGNSPVVIKNDDSKIIDLSNISVRFEKYMFISRTYLNISTE